MKAIAIDDEPLALEIIKAHAPRLPAIQLEATFTNALLGLQWLQQHQVDLIFLDIKMPDISGIELYSSLLHKPMVIFTTAYADHALSGFELDAVDYLLKPVSLSRYLKACNKALELYHYRKGSMPGTAGYIMVRSGNGQVRVSLADILYAEATGNYVQYVCKTQKLLARSTFAEALHALPEVGFARIHRSYVVNLQHVQRADKLQVELADISLPLSEAYVRPFFDKWR
ncbi:MAG: LytTR family DNA-binding domain-containing protein [Chitinophagaceae bacterium]|jgi:DNA-binding LytR/AlgR family response regulator|nr:LytTR family DNA-binding domain-containing protein [Chitinophagaceae bacterium]